MPKIKVETEDTDYETIVSDDELDRIKKQMTGSVTTPFYIDFGKNLVVASHKVIALVVVKDESENS